MRKEKRGKKREEKKPLSDSYQFISPRDQLFFTLAGPTSAHLLAKL